MKTTIVGIFIFLTANLLMVVSFQEYAIFEDEDIYNQALPPLPYSGVTVPGTKWCGPGNISDHYEDLGRFRETDKCCRGHDHCPEVIEPASTLHSLFNPDMFPRLTCECEQVFLNCLQSVNDFASNSVGRAYFGARSFCFKQYYPALECMKYQEGTFSKRCIKYKFDLTKPSRWQFFNIPFYSVKK